MVVARWWLVCTVLLTATLPRFCGTAFVGGEITSAADNGHFSFSRYPAASLQKRNHNTFKERATTHGQTCMRCRGPSTTGGAVCNTCPLVVVVEYDTNLRGRWCYLSSCGFVGLLLREHLQS